MSGCTLVWFRRDLRLRDNDALLAAAGLGSGIVPVFIWSPQEEKHWAPGAASRWWLHQSLRALDTELRKAGSRLILRRGPTRAALLDLVTQCGADSVFWNRLYEPGVRERDEQVEAFLRRREIRVETFCANLLAEPRTILNSSGKPFQVFTPFWKACSSRPEPTRPRSSPRRLRAPKRWPRSVVLARFELEPKIDWAGGLRAAWEPGERGAARELSRFLKKGLREYPRQRDFPGLAGTSRLSPHLHFGETGPRQVWHSTMKAAGRDREARKCATAFLRQLYWREFAAHLLFHFPHTHDKPLRPEYAMFPWQRGAKNLSAWQKGRTGFPIVDAGMRELWRTGWMHNRVRMIVGSFLVKDLLLPWQEGAKWFWDTLVDADLANNTLGWQWVAGCGADAAPYFRIFNPVSQGEDYDPQGAYVRRWVPELAQLPAKWIHRPWAAPPEVLQTAGVRLGQSYPAPIVDHDAARIRALEAFAAMKVRRERKSLRVRRSGGESSGASRTPAGSG